MTEPSRAPGSQAHPVPVEPVDPAGVLAQEPATAPPARPVVPRSRSGPMQTRRVPVFGFGIIQYWAIGHFRREPASASWTPG